MIDIASPFFGSLLFSLEEAVQDEESENEEPQALFGDRFGGAILIDEQPELQNLPDEFVGHQFGGAALIGQPPEHTVENEESELEEGEVRDQFEIEINIDSSHDSEQDSEEHLVRYRKTQGIFNFIATKFNFSNKFHSRSKFPN